MCAEEKDSKEVVICAGSTREYIVMGVLSVGVFIATWILMMSTGG